jgi:hypothetical protein
MRPHAAANIGKRADDDAHADRGDAAVLVANRPVEQMYLSAVVGAAAKEKFGLQAYIVLSLGIKELEVWDRDLSVSVQRQPNFEQTSGSKMVAHSSMMNELFGVTGSLASSCTVSFTSSCSDISVVLTEGVGRNIDWSEASCETCGTSGSANVICMGCKTATNWWICSRSQALRDGASFSPWLAGI